MNKEFKPGQRWRMRDGDIATIESVDRSMEYPVLYSYRHGDGRDRRTARLDGRYSDREECRFDLIEQCDTQTPAPEQPLGAFLQAARNDLVEQALRFAEIADSVASNRNWESVVKLKMLTAMLQQVIEQEGTL
jgi:hypothetical protein